MGVSHDVLDVAALADLYNMGGAPLVVQVLDLFLESAPRKLASSEAAFAAGDLAGVVPGVHFLISSGGNLGALRIRDLAHEAEAAARSGKSARVGELLPELSAALAEVTPLLVGLREAPETLEG